MTDQHPDLCPGRAPALSAAEAYATLAGVDFTRHDLRGVLGAVADVARRSLVGPGGGEASVTLLRGARAYSAAFTGPAALALDETQYGTGYGPCLEAATAGETIVVPDMADESRWPAFASAALDAGILSSLSLSLPIQQGVVGAMNVYSIRPGTFDPAAVDLGAGFAAYAAVAIGNAHLYDHAATEARQMREAMANRAVIEQAKGILMADRRCTAAQAFEILRDISNKTNRKLHDVAAALVNHTTGHEPS